MSAPAAVGVERPTVRIRGTAYPVLLPTLRDPRLHLAGVIISLQVLGQVAFDFQLSIAQILVAVLTSAVLEVGIAFRRQRVLMWPASALLTGNGVAFILRVPGTEHGDWWSMNGAWIFAATSAVALLSKYLIQFRGRHVFNPSNFGLVPCFLLLGPERADPLAFWWGPMSPALVLAIVLIVAGGFAILGRLHLTGIAVGFWLAFAAGIGVLALSGHSMTAAWHVGPIEGAEFWWTLVSSPEILVFLFFMITDPRTIPESGAGRRAYAVGVGLLATLLIAPFTTEFATKVAVLGALFLVCAARPLLVVLGSTRLASRRTLSAAPRRVAAAASLGGALVFAGILVAAGTPARPGSELAPVTAPQALPKVTVLDSQGVAQIDESTARSIARDVVTDLRIEAEALQGRDLDRAADGASGEWLAVLWQQIEDAPEDAVAPAYAVETIELSLLPGDNQGPPRVVARLEGAEMVPRTVELALEGDRYRIVRSDGSLPFADASGTPVAGSLAGTSFENVASEVGLDFRHGAFRFGVSSETTAMMGGGLCWLDYDADGWLDLFVVNSYSEADITAWEARAGLPRSALFRNVRGRFEDVSARAHADLPVRGDGCVAADLDLDGDTDLYVTTAGYNVPTDGDDALLWNEGDGTFAEGARAAGINAVGWHTGAAVGDVDGNGLPDLFVASYTDVNWPILGSAAGFPTNHHAVRDLLYLNEGVGTNGRTTFREVARRVGIEPRGAEHGLGASFLDVNGDGRVDLYVANDADPNQLYANVPWPGGAAADPAGLGFRLQEIARSVGVADPNAGMGVAAADYSLDGRLDLLVTNSRGQLHAAYRSRPAGAHRAAYADARPTVAAAVGTRGTGWGASWADFDLDGDLDFAIANGAIPVRNLGNDAQEVQVFENEGGRGAAVTFGRLPAGDVDAPPLNGRGLATADYDNDGDLDIAVNGIGGRLVLLRNRGRKSGHWLEVSLATFAPGTVITAVLPDGRRLVRQAIAGSSYLSSEDPRVHFGLGNATRVKELRVRFPDGSVVRRRGLAVDRIVAVGP
jgi:ASPIC and UnbV/FG-GAP-like repeat